jgi:hypothetical protein
MSAHEVGRRAVAVAVLISAAAIAVGARAARAADEAARGAGHVVAAGAESYGEAQHRRQRDESGER